MAGPVLASEMINKITFSVDMGSYNRTLKMIRKIKSELLAIKLVIQNMPPWPNPPPGPPNPPPGPPNPPPGPPNPPQGGSRGTGSVNARIERRMSAFNYEASLMNRLDTTQISRFRAQARHLSSELRTGSLSVQMYNERMRQLVNTMRRQNRESLTLGERLRAVRGQMLFIGMTAGFAIKSVTDTGRQLQNVGIMMNTVFGDQAASQVDFLRSQTERLGVSFADSAKNFTQLQFAGQQAGMSISDMQNIYLGVTEASQVFGMSQDEVSGSMRAIIQMFS